MDENDERLVDLRAFNNKVVGGTTFLHKRMHKHTWVSHYKKQYRPDRDEYKNQKVHIA